MDILLKINNLLTEDVIETPTSISELKTILERDCKPFLKEIKLPGEETFSSEFYDLEKNFLFRGIKESKNFVKYTTKKDRKPKDTPYQIHNLFNEVFYKKFKVKDIRSQAIFVTGNYNDAQMYGSYNYIIFPIGKFSFWYSPKVADLFGLVEANIFDIGIELTRSTKVGDKNLRNMNNVFENIIPTYTNKNLTDSFLHKGGVEVMLLCDSYYAIKEMYYQKLLDKEDEL